MDARSFRPALGAATLLLFLLCTSVSAQFGRRQSFTAHSQNFIVFASSQPWANQVAEMAELNRRNLALHWLGKELPTWAERIPIHVESAPNLGAGGETRFLLINGNSIGNWMMSVQGTQERILDSVLPHEITHTIFATHFAPLGKYVPRWADEGASTTVEHIAEKSKHQQKLHEFLRTGYGLAFNKMFSLKEYPDPILPLYAQGHSAVQFLIDQGGPQKFVKFLEEGMRTEAWNESLQEYYAYESIGQFQTMWNKWLADGSPENLLAYAPILGRDQPVSASLAAQGSAVDGNIVLVSNPQPNSNSQAGPQLASVAEPSTLQSSQAIGNESWYKRRLREVRGDGTAPSGGQSATAAGNWTELAGVPAEKIPAGAPPSYSRQAVSRPQPTQSAGIQVLDWGNSVPVSGLQSRLLTTTPPTGAAPIYR